VGSTEIGPLTNNNTKKKVEINSEKTPVALSSELNEKKIKNIEIMKMKPLRISSRDKGSSFSFSLTSTPI
tara:strand:+ start:27 stop:236 length:210 start_codon:yes stop_codon:yes gene_type:complete